METTTSPGADPAVRMRDDPSRRLRFGAGVVTVSVLLGAFVYGQRERSRSAATDPELTELRAAAALPDCPSGLGAELPDMTLPCLGGGQNIDVQSTGTSLPTVVNIWGSWCAPCLEEVPDLIAFAAQTEGRVTLVGVNSSDDDRSALAFAAKIGMNYPSVVDADGTFSRSYGQGTPKTLFLDSQGDIVHVKIGGFRDRTELEVLSSRYLGVTV